MRYRARGAGDHGPWNSWNRVPYITEERFGPGQPSIVPKDIHIHSNFFLGNYHAICAIDTDDGSSYIKIYNNVLGYATAGLKSDFGTSLSGTNVSLGHQDGRVDPCIFI